MGRPVIRTNARLHADDLGELMSRTKWKGRRVRDLLPEWGLTADRLEWADRRGDLRRAWRECDDIMLLALLADGMGATSEHLREIIIGLAPDIPRGEGAPPLDVWKRAEIGDRAAINDVGTWLNQRGHRTTREEYERRLERLRAEVRPEDYFDFDEPDDTLH